MQPCVVILIVTEYIVWNCQRLKGKQACLLILTGVPGITTPIGSLFRSAGKLCHLKINQKLMTIVLVDVVVP